METNLDLIKLNQDLNIEKPRIGQKLLMCKTMFNRASSIQIFRTWKTNIDWTEIDTNQTDLKHSKHFPQVIYLQIKLKNKGIEMQYRWFCNNCMYIAYLLQIR